MITLKVTEQRVEEIPFSVYRQVGKDPDAQARFIAHFAINDSGDYMTMDEALKEMDQLTLGEIVELSEQIRTRADEIAAPKV